MELYEVWHQCMSRRRCAERFIGQTLERLISSFCPLPSSFGMTALGFENEAEKCHKCYAMADIALVQGHYDLEPCPCSVLIRQLWDIIKWNPEVSQSSRRLRKLVEYPHDLPPSMDHWMLEQYRGTSEWLHIWMNQWMLMAAGKYIRWLGLVMKDIERAIGEEQR